MTAEPFKKPLVVLVHGYLDDPTVWRDVAAALNAEHCRTIAPEIARRDGDLTLAAFAEVVSEATRAAIAEGGEDGVVFVGHSMGAQVAELAARGVGDAARGLVLISPIPLEGLALPEEVAVPLRGCGEDVEIQRALRTQLSTALGDEAIDELVRIGVAVPKERVEGWFDAWTSGVPTSAAQAPPSVPVMVLSGAEDAFISKDILRLVEARFPKAIQHSLPGTGHWPTVEASNAVAAELVTFLSDLGAQSTEGANGEAWTGAFQTKERDAFAERFSPDVVLQASALRRPLTGRADVSYLMGEASQIYEKLEFLHEVQDEKLTFLEWRAQTRSGVSLEGVTVLERDDLGMISRVAIHHRPLDGVLAFSSELRARTLDRLGDSYFWSGTPHA